MVDEKPVVKKYKLCAIEGLLEVSNGMINYKKVKTIKRGFKRW